MRRAAKWLLAIAALAAGCGDSRRSDAAQGASAARADWSPAGERGLRPDDDPAAVAAADLAARLGKLPTPARAYRLGVVVRFLGNPYFQLLTHGMHSRAKELGISIVVQAGANESDQAGQRAVFEAMIDRGYDAILLAPQTDANLAPAVERARAKGVPLINVDSALLGDAGWFVGPNHRRSGIDAASGVAERTAGGKVALIRGVEADYGANQRAKGFTAALPLTGGRVVAQPPCAWDLQTAARAASRILREHPDLAAFVCDSDVMALGVVEAVASAGRTGQVAVVGRDGIAEAVEAVRAGSMAGTVDARPVEMGRTAVEVALRILEGQDVPRVVHTQHRFVAARAGGGAAPPHDRAAVR